MKENLEKLLKKMGRRKNQQILQRKISVVEQVWVRNSDYTIENTLKKNLKKLEQI